MKNTTTQKLYSILKEGKTVSSHQIRKAGISNPSAAVHRLREKLWNQGDYWEVYTNKTGYRLGMQRGAEKRLTEIHQELVSALYPTV